MDIFGNSNENGGDIIGPASSTTNALVRYADTTGKLLKNSTVTLSDDGTLTGLNIITPSTGQPLRLYGDLDMGQNFIIDLATPVNDYDAVTKEYVDGKAGNQTATTGLTTFTGTVEAGIVKKTGGTSIQYMMADGSVLSQSASSGNSNFYLYKSHTNTPTPPPTAGFVYYNNAIQKNATIIYISHLTEDNIDIEIFFQNLSTLNEVYIQQKILSDNFIKYNITGTPTVVTGSHISIPVAQVSFGGTGEISFGTNEPILVSFFTNNLEVDTRLSNLETTIQNKITAPLTTVTNSAVAVFDGTTGKVVKQSPVKISDAGVVEGISSVNGFLTPALDYAYDLGDIGKNWAAVHTASLQSNNGVISVETNLNMGQFSIDDLATPTTAYQAVNKLYADSPSAFTIPNLSNANIFALSATNGRTAYNTDSNLINVYINGAWGNVLATKRTISLLRVVPMTSNNAPAPFVASASTIWSAVYDVFKAFDNSITTEWFSAQAPLYTLTTPGTYAGTVSTTVSGAPVLGEWLQLAFTSVTVHSYTITVNNAYRNNAAPTSWVVAGSSNGGTTWTTLDTKTRVWTGNTSQSYNFSAPVEINAIRLIVRETYNVSGLVAYTTAAEFIINKVAHVVDDNINISSTKTFTPPKLTTAERNLLIPDEGNVIYNTTTKVLNTYNGTAWV